MCNLAYLTNLLRKMFEINLSLQKETIAVFKETSMSVLLRENLGIGCSGLTKEITITFLFLKKFENKK